jgi:hypothetical protein
MEKNHRNTMLLVELTAEGFLVPSEEIEAPPAWGQITVVAKLTAFTHLMPRFLY